MKTVLVCQRCQLETKPDAQCHPEHTIRVEASSIVRDAHNRVIDCAQASTGQSFRAAKELL